MTGVSSPDSVGQSRVAKDSALFLAAQLGSRVLNFAYFFVLARSLPTEGFGVLNLALSLIVMADIIIDLGLSRYAMREMSKHPEQTALFLGTILPYKLFAVIGFYAAIALFVLASNLDTESQLIFLAAALGIFLIAPSMLFENIMQAHQKFALISTAHVALSVTQFVTGGLILLWGGSTLAIAFTFAVSNLVYCGFMVWGTFRIVKRPIRLGNVRLLIQLVAPAFPYLCSAFIVMLALRAEFLVLGYFGSREDLGVFSVAMKILEASLLLPIVLGTVLAPRFSIAHAKPQWILSDLYGSSLEALLLVAIPCAALAYGLAPIVPWLFSERSFDELDDLLRVLYLGYPAACIFLLNTSILFGAVRQTKPIILLIFLASLQIGTNIVLQSKFAMWGATMAFVIFMTAAAVISTAFIVFQYVSLGRFGKAMVAPAAGGLATIAAFLIVPLETEAAKLPFALLFYLGASLFARKIVLGGSLQWRFEP